jgi:hypothetical protein
VKVKHLKELLSGKDPEAKVLVRMDGSIFGTDSAEEHNNYNHESECEFFVLAVDDFPDGE